MFFYGFKKKGAVDGNLSEFLIGTSLHNFVQ